MAKIHRPLWPYGARWNRVSKNPCPKCAEFTDQVRLCSLFNIQFLHSSIYLLNAYHAHYLALWEVRIKTQSLLGSRVVKYT